MDRRHFVMGAFGATCVYGLHAAGLPQGGAREQGAARAGKFPGYLGEAVRAMRASGRGGLVYILPDELKQREKALLVLHGLFQGTPNTPPARPEAGGPAPREAYEDYVHAWSRDAIRVAASAVVICLTREDASRYFVASERQTRIVLDPQARVIAREEAPRADAPREGTPREGAARVRAPALPTPQSLWRSIYGPDGLRLRRIAKTARKLLGEEERSLCERFLDRVRAKDLGSRELAAARREVRPIQLRISAICQQDAIGNAELEERLLRERRIHRIQSQQKAMPFGATLPQLPKRDPCPACGMAIMMPQSLRFVGKLR